MVDGGEENTHSSVGVDALSDTEVGDLDVVRF